MWLGIFLVSVSFLLVQLFYVLVLCCYRSALEPSDVNSRLRVSVCSSDSSG